LTNTREQIEVIKGRMQYLEQSSNLALFNVNLEQSKLIAEFTAETRTVKEGESVMFIANVSGGFYPYTYLWDFGDDETSSEANPSHVYHADGTYTVSLKITDDKGNTAEYTREDYMTVLVGWSAGSVADSAWNALASFGRGLSALFIGLGIWSLVWIPILVIILYFVWWRRRKPKKS
jgi:PKD repeat protein